MADHPLMRRMLAIALIAVLGSACASTEKQPGDGSNAASEESVGEFLETRAEDVWDIEQCASRSKHYLRLDALEVSPAMVAPGDSLTQRIVYTMCGKAGQRLSGTLRTLISLERRAVFRETIDFAVKPGRWAVISKVVVPPDAVAGAYHLSVDFSAKRARFARTADFSVAP